MTAVGVVMAVLAFLFALTVINWAREEAGFYRFLLLASSIVFILDIYVGVATATS